MATVWNKKTWTVLLLNLTALGYLCALTQHLLYAIAMLCVSCGSDRYTYKSTPVTSQEAIN